MTRRFFLVLLAVVAVGVVLPARVVAAGSRPAFALIARDTVILRSAPRANARSLAQLIQQAQVRLLERRGSWERVEVWASIKGWVPRADLTTRAPWVSVSTYKAPAEKTIIHAAGPEPVSAWGSSSTGTARVARPGGPITGWLGAGTRVHFDQWQQDAAGKIWYRTGGSWVLGDSVRFDAHHPLAPIRGKGMWLTLGSVNGTDPRVLAAAAHRDGVTHLYVESAISPLGFHGRGSVGPLIDSAHRLHISVLAWVFPYLKDVAADVGLTQTVAAYRTPNGGRFDGIAADLETNIQVWNVRAYSQLIRSLLGSRYLLVGVTYPPQSFPDFPFADVGRMYDLIAPMDYWHQTRTAYGLDYGHMSYGWAYGYRYAVDSIARIRAAAGQVAVEPIGQTFDDFGRLEMGPYAPSAAEIAGFMRGCASAHAPGVSFFQWMTATAPEWQVIHDSRLP